MTGDALFDSAGALRDDYARVDWSRTPLGDPAGWSPTLRSTVTLMLHTRYPVTLLWGPEFVLVYNEAYVELIAGKHPAALGSRCEDVFPEAWDVIAPMMRGVLAGGEATWVEDAAIPLRRHGRLEEAYFTFSYSAVPGPDGTIEGVLDITAESTRAVLDSRRQRVLSRLREWVAEVDSAEELAAQAPRLLRGDDLESVAIGLPGERSDVVPVRTRRRGRHSRAPLTIDPAEGPGRVVTLPLGLAEGDGETPLLVGRLRDQVTVDDRLREFLSLIATTFEHALERFAVREAELRISETLQRSLLTEPADTPGLEIAARYLPADREAQVGGDWYDAFELPDGRRVVAIGDVSGHDTGAAAAMAQARSLLRGIAYTLHGPAHRLLSGLDQAMQGLAPEHHATAIVGLVDLDEGLFEWSNAGHLPPVLIEPDGTARLLATRPEPLLGVGFAGRTDHLAALGSGATIVFYTDGLIERRTQSLDRGFEQLVTALDGRHHASPDALCDHLLRRFATGAGSRDDDVALLVVRVA